MPSRKTICIKNETGTIVFNDKYGNAAITMHNETKASSAFFVVGAYYFFDITSIAKDDFDSNNHVGSFEQAQTKWNK